MDFTFLFLYTFNIKLSHGEDYKLHADTGGIKWWSDLFCYVCWWYYYTYPNDPIANSDSWWLHTCAVLKTPFVFLKKEYHSLAIFNFYIQINYSYHSLLSLLLTFILWPIVFSAYCTISSQKFKKWIFLFSCLLSIIFLYWIIMKFNKLSKCCKNGLICLLLNSWHIWLKSVKLQWVCYAF